MLRLLKACWKSVRGLFKQSPEPRNYLKERYGMDEKPEGWNDAVLGYFHSGPELRDSDDEEFSRAFEEKSGSNSRL